MAFWRQWRKARWSKDGSVVWVLFQTLDGAAGLSWVPAAAGRGPGRVFMSYNEPRAWVIDPGADWQYQPYKHNVEFDELVECDCKKCTTRDLAGITFFEKNEPVPETFVDMSFGYHDGSLQIYGGEGSRFAGGAIDRLFMDMTPGSGGETATRALMDAGVVEVWSIDAERRGKTKLLARRQGDYAVVHLGYVDGGAIEGALRAALVILQAGAPGYQILGRVGAAVQAGFAAVLHLLGLLGFVVDSSLREEQRRALHSLGLVGASLEFYREFDGTLDKLGRFGATMQVWCDTAIAERPLDLDDGYVQTSVESVVADSTGDRFRYLDI